MTETFQIDETTWVAVREGNFAPRHFPSQNAAETWIKRVDRLMNRRRRRRDDD